MVQHLSLFGMSGESAQFREMRAYEQARGFLFDIVPLRGFDGDKDPGLTHRRVAGFALETIEYAKRLKRQGGSPIVLVGHSRGGAVAHVAAQMRPDLFAAVVMVAPALLGPVSKAAERALAKRFLRYLPMLVFRRPFRLHQDDIWTLFFNDVHDVETAAAVRRMAAQPDSSAYMREALRKRLSAPAVPTTVIIAEDDRVLDTEAQDEWARCHGVPVRRVAGSHMQALKSVEVAAEVARVAGKIRGC